MKQVITTIKRGDSFIGRLIKNDQASKYTIQIEVNQEIVKEELASIDEEESEMKLNSLMDQTYRELQRPHPQARRKI